MYLYYMKIIITEEQFKRVISENDKMLARMNTPEIFSKIVRNFDNLQETNCDEINLLSYDTPNYVKLYCKSLQGRSLEEIEKLEDMALNVLAASMFRQQQRLSDFIDFG